MKFIGILTLLACAASLSACATDDAASGGSSAKASGSPSTLGDLQDRGAKRLDAEELRKLVTGAEVTGGVTAGGRYSMRNDADGRFTGTFTSSGGSNDRIWGRWRIDDSGRLCGTNEAARMSEICSQYYVLDGTYYSTSGEGRSAPVAVRRISR